MIPQNIEQVRNELHNVLRRIKDGVAFCENHPKQTASFYNIQTEEILCYKCACDMARQVKKIYGKQSQIFNHGKNRKH